MTVLSTASKSLVLAAMLASPALAVSAQETGAQGEVLTTVYAPQPPAMEEMLEGPDVEGFISAREGNRVRVTATDGTSHVLTVTEQTRIRARGGFLGLGRETLGIDALLNGLPVEIETRQWDGGLVAADIRFSDDDLETAEMIRSGTSARFAANEAAIEENTEATEALRGRFGDIDKYNIRATTNVYFDTGRSDLSPRARAELCRVAQQAEATDNALLLVVGYTDSTGSYEINQRLSDERAERVVNYLQQQCGWAPYRMLRPAGMAESDPVADNETEYGKAQNRRVAVNVLVSKSVDGL
ncbi:OmpA family protein [Qipengyuania nanhaisediminis]|uniref:OmpA family protein n=1 Tax=Qipengyuania nanhaisediminis TaxID=604088 RepID=UPI0038B40FD0